MGGELFTNSRTVTLSLDASAIFTNLTSPEMGISNTESSLENWEPFNATKNWTLTDTDGLKTVYARFRINTSPIPGEPEYNLSKTFKAVITIDMTPPSLNITYPGVNGTQITLSTLRVNWAVEDEGAGLGHNQIRLVLPYQTT